MLSARTRALDHAGLGVRAPARTLRVAKGVEAAEVLLDVAMLPLGRGEGAAHLIRRAIPEGEGQGLVMGQQAHSAVAGATRVGLEQKRHGSGGLGQVQRQ
eukprot:scaffold18539_cov54-Phaeocystis_antarctica.AAC.1